MISRREVVQGGVLSIIWGTGHAVAQIANPPRASYAGCILRGRDADRVMSRVTSHGLFATGNEPIITNSGDRAFDYALAQTLFRISEALDVLPGFAFYDDIDGENAFATPQRRMSHIDGTVLFGQRLLRAVLSEVEHPDVAATAICAHEFGHIVQFKRDLLPILSAGQRTVKRTELHADFLAGFFAGRRKLQKRNYPAAVFAQKQYSSGDPHVDNPDHHGRPEERAAAIVRGFETAYVDRRPLADAVQIGLRYVGAA